jgi:hypothetical protein
MRMMILGIAAVLAAVWVTSAFAAGNGPTSAVYKSSAVKVQTGITVTTTSPPTSTTLPFTGLDLGLICAAGVLLVIVGFALRRLARRSSQL